MGTGGWPEEIPPWAAELERCELCEWRCGVNRLAGELGVCRVAFPQVACRTLHPAPPSSYTIFMAGCNFRCLHCQNYDIACYPDGGPIDGYCDPAELAAEAVAAVASTFGRLIAADRLFFSGGSPTPSLPYIEEIVRCARKLDPEAKVNYDTNGFLTADALERVLEFTTSITFDIRAVSDEVHRAMTGAPVAPVLRNAARVAERREKLWEFRVLVVPGINEEEIEGICQFLADLDPGLPVCFLAFRPNFVLESHPGASRALMQEALATARRCGLRNVHWSGRPDIPGATLSERNRAYLRPGAQLAGAYAQRVGCATHPRNCGACPALSRCPVRSYKPTRRT